MLAGRDLLTNDVRASLCTLLQTIGEVDCHEGAFTQSHSKDDDMETLYFYSLLDSPHGFTQAAASALCSASDQSCLARTVALLGASSIDLSFDSKEQQAKLSAFWPPAPCSVAVSKSGAAKTEVGVMGLDRLPNAEPHELGMSGFLSVVSDEKEASPVMFNFPARHRLTVGTFSASFVKPTGLHPTLKLSLSANTSVRQDGKGACKPYAFLTLPKTIFADRYQLADALFLASKNLSSSPYTTLPVDLEAPAYTTKAWGSSVLLELAKPEEGQDWTAEVPLHLRYLEPSDTGLRTEEVPYPAVFWACKTREEIDFGGSPFDRANVGYDSLFSSNTVFWHVNPKPDSGRLTASVDVPVLTTGYEEYISMGTSAAIALGFGWVLWKLVSGYSSDSGKAKAATPSKAKGKRKAKST